MDAAIELRYARSRPRLGTRGRVRLVALCLCAILAGIVVWLGITRVKRLEAAAGPVDWPTVLSSLTLRAAAWHWPADNNPQRLWEVMGLEVDGVDVKLQTPFRFDAGKVTIPMQITNRGTRPIIVPPFRIDGYVPREVGCHPAQILAIVDSGLQKGVFVLPPGQSASVPITVPADTRPAGVGIHVIFDRRHDFLVWAGGGLDGRYPYADWSAVPDECISRIR